MHRLVIVTLLALSSAGAMAAQVYKWVDERGVTHFGAQPPEGATAQPVNTLTGTGSSTPTPRAPTPPPAPAKDDKQEAIDDKVKAEVADKEAKRVKYCEDLRLNLANLKNNPRLMGTAPDGSPRRLTEEERQARIKEDEGNIQTHCQD